MDTSRPNNPLRPAAAICPTAGDWRLDRLPKSRTVFLALALSAGAHAAFLLLFNQPAARPLWVQVPVGRPIDDGPWIPDPEPPPPTTTEVTDLKDPSPVNLPRQLDLPNPVTVLTDFVVPLQPPPPPIDLTAEKVLKIPTRTGDPRALPPTTVFNPEQLDKAPRAVAQPAPRFPYELREHVSAAEVVVEFIVDSAGSVQGATIVSSTHAGFDRATLDGVRQWKFRPGMKDGRKVNTRIRQPIRFALE